MRVIYHIGAAGPALCSAAAGNCPLSASGEHFESAQAAYTAFEAAMESSLFEPLSKPAVEADSLPADSTIALRLGKLQRRVASAEAVAAKISPLRESIAAANERALKLASFPTLGSSAGLRKKLAEELHGLKKLRSLLGAYEETAERLPELRAQLAAVAGELSS